MVKYFCHNCNDTYLKTLTAVVNHAWNEHGIVFERIWQPLIRSEDAHVPPTETTVRKAAGFRCEDCGVVLETSRSLLRHLDSMHSVHIWYEKGVTKKRVNFDGILDAPISGGKTGQQRLSHSSKENLPLSKRPYEPRKSSSE